MFSLMPLRFGLVHVLMLVFGCCIVACSIAKTSHLSKQFPAGDYDYTSYDEKGNKVVQGRISITSSESRRVEGSSEPMSQLKGNWELKKVGNQAPIGNQEGKGELVGSLARDEISLNLNPNIADANVYLRGRVDGKRFHGTWSFNGEGGPISKGTFEGMKR